MLSDETNPAPVDETTVDGSQTTTPETGSESGQFGESISEQPEASQEALTLEQYQDMVRERDEKIANLNKGFTESSQLKSQYERENEQLRSALGQFVDYQRQQVDPRSAAEAEYRAARENFDTDAELRALNRIRELDRQAVIQEAVRMNQAATAAERVKQQYGYDVNDLAQFHANMDPELIAKAKLIADGRYEDVATKEREAREAEAARAAAVGRLVGEGTPGVVPGGYDAGPVKEINDITFGLLPRAKQKELIEDGFRVRNPRGEDVTPSL